MSELPEEIDGLREGLDTNDVGQKRYLMNTIFHRVLEHKCAQEDLDPGHKERIEKLREFDGYLYKLSQDFLTSSSTFEKEQKLEKILDHIQ